MKKIFIQVLFVISIFNFSLAQEFVFIGDSEKICDKLSAYSENELVDYVQTEVLPSLSGFISQSDTLAFKQVMKCIKQAFSGDFSSYGKVAPGIEGLALKYYRNFDKDRWLITLDNIFFRRVGQIDFAVSLTKLNNGVSEDEKQSIEKMAYAELVNSFMPDVLFACEHSVYWSKSQREKLSEIFNKLNECDMEQKLKEYNCF